MREFAFGRSDIHVDENLNAFFMSKCQERLGTQEGMAMNAQAKDFFYQMFHPAGEYWSERCSRLTGEKRTGHGDT